MAGSGGSITHRMIETNGINMHIAEQGSGPLVLLIHGFPELWYSWRHQIVALAEAGYHVVAPDMRGYGDTEVPPDFHHYTYFHIVGDLIGLLDALGHPKAFVVGHDWGSLIASHLCLFRPDRVIALVNISVPFQVRDPNKKPIEKMRSYFGEGYYMCRFQEPGRAEEEFARYDCTEVIKRLLLATKTSLFAAPSNEGIIDALEAPATLPSWITEEEIQYFAKQFEKTGFTGGFNYYRALDLNWELLAPWTGGNITVPTKYIVGDKDLVYNTPGTKNYVHGGGYKKTVPFLEEVVVLEGGHHFIQQEKPEEISLHILEFIGKFRLSSL
uniref:soluble epoxide hydrolase n=1 Tax=Araucaria cunninghamii TaxID=56994 RepID=A0A0D6R310_ARACU